MPSSRGPSRLRDGTWVSCIAGKILYHLRHQGASPQEGAGRVLRTNWSWGEKKLELELFGKVRDKKFWGLWESLGEENTKWSAGIWSSAQQCLYLSWPWMGHQTLGLRCPGISLLVCHPAFLPKVWISQTFPGALQVRFLRYQSSNLFVLWIFGNWLF